MKGGRKMRFILLLAAIAIIVPFTTVLHALTPAASNNTGGAHPDQSFLAFSTQPETPFILAAVETKGGACSIHSESASPERGAFNSGKNCGHGIRPCSASQVGQPCDPNNPSFVCSAQANGAYCCLPYVP